jgi:GNAT acetyltransferase 2
MIYTTTVYNSKEIFISLCECMKLFVHRSCVKPVLQQVIDSCLNTVLTAVFILLYHVNSTVCVCIILQVALEGKISRASVQSALARGQRASGDLIPWTLSQQFQDSEFPVSPLNSNSYFHHDHYDS